MTAKWVYLVLFVLLLILGGYFLYSRFYTKNLIDEPLAKITPCKYKYINPNRCEPELAIRKKEYVILRNELVELIEERETNGVLSSAAVYFRDLQNGPTLNIHAQENFIPASLLKLPLMLTYYKKAEEDPSILKRNIRITGDIASLPQNIVPQKTAELGKTYSIDALLTLLIVHSDNTAWKVLLNDLRTHYSEEDFIETLSDLGIVDPRKRTDQQYITVQSYAAIFRILYNASYLNLEMSNKALHLLQQSDFQDGLIAGVPKGTVIAHKFGEQNNGEEQQLHDCGIIYYTANPYILCVMTRGKNIAELAPIIKNISERVYTEVEKRNKEQE